MSRPRSGSPHSNALSDRPATPLTDPRTTDDPFPTSPQSGSPRTPRTTPRKLSLFAMARPQTPAIAEDIVTTTAPKPGSTQQ